MDHEQHDHAHDHSEESETPPGITSDQIDGAFVPSPRPEVVGVEVDGEVVIVDGETGVVRHLDPIGSVVWQCLDGNATVEEISADLAAAFRAEPAVVAGDVLALTRTLGGQGLLDGVEPDRPAQFQEPSGFPVGTELPGFSLATLDGGTFDLEAQRGRTTMLVHWSPRCGFCDRIAPDLVELHPHLEREGIDLVLLSIGSIQDNEEKLASLGLQTRLALKEEIDPELDPFRGQGTPCAYLLDEQGRTASELAVGAFDVPWLIRGTVGLPDPEPEIQVAESAPEEEPETELEPVAAADERAQPKFLVEPKST